MKVTLVKLKAVTSIAFAIWSVSSFAQSETMMYVMKNGEVVFSSSVSDVDNVIFNEASSDSALIVQKNDGSPAGKILLNDIRQLFFSNDGLYVETLSSSEGYAFEDIAKLLFGDINSSGISVKPAQSSFDVLVYITSAGDVTVESPIAIKSLTLFSIDGKMISKQHYNGVETRYATSLQNAPAGVYLLRAETERDAVVKKIVKP